MANKDAVVVSPLLGCNSIMTRPPVKKRCSNKRIATSGRPSTPNRSICTLFFDATTLFLLFAFLLPTVAYCDSSVSAASVSDQLSEPAAPPPAKQPMLVSASSQQSSSLKEPASPSSMPTSTGTTFAVISSALVIAGTILYFALFKSSQESPGDEKADRESPPSRPYSPSHRTATASSDFIDSQFDDTDCQNTFAKSPLRINVDHDSLLDDHELCGWVPSIVPRARPLASSTPVKSLSPARHTSLHGTSFVSSLHQLARTAKSDEFAVLAVADQSTLDECDSLHRTPLHVAIEWNNYAAVEFLLQNGASVEITYADGLDALQLACKYRRAEIVGLLLRANARLRRVSASKWSPLHFAALSNAASIVDMLLSAGGNPNECDIWFETPLHKAAAENSIEAAKRLIAAGASLDVKNFKDETPFTIASTKSHDKLASLLRTTMTT